VPLALIDARRIDFNGKSGSAPRRDRHLGTARGRRRNGTKQLTAANHRRKRVVFV